MATADALIAVARHCVALNPTRPRSDFEPPETSDESKRRLETGHAFALAIQDPLEEWSWAHSLLARLVADGRLHPEDVQWAIRCEQHCACDRPPVGACIEEECANYVCESCGPVCPDCVRWIDGDWPEHVRREP